MTTTLSLTTKGYRICPRCEKKRWWDPEKKGGEWYMRRRLRTVEEFDGEDEWTVKKLFIVPSAYCRGCMNRDRAARRKRDKALARLDQLTPNEANELRAREFGTCSACGVAGPNRTYVSAPFEGFLCQLCLGCLRESGGDAAQARRYWLTLFFHISHEAKLTKEFEDRQGDGRKRKWHQGNSEVTPDSPPHVHCIMMEKQWRKVMQWLSAEEEVQAVPTLSLVQDSLGPSNDADGVEPPDDAG